MEKERKQSETTLRPEKKEKQVINNLKNLIKEEDKDLFRRMWDSVIKKPWPKGKRRPLP